MKKFFGLVLIVLIVSYGVSGAAPWISGGGGSGDVTAPASPTAGSVPKWGTGKALVDAFPVGTTFTNGKLCSYATVTGVTCDADASGGTPTSITVSDNQTDTTEFPLLVGAATGDLGPRTRSTLTYNAVTGLLSSTLFGGDGASLTAIGTTKAVNLTVAVRAGEYLRKGQVVYISGTSAGIPMAWKVDATVLGKARAIGIAQSDMNPGDATIDGFIRRGGTLTGIDARTSGTVAGYVNPLQQTWANGDLLFALGGANAGGLTNVRPTSGRSVKVAYAVNGNDPSCTFLMHVMENPVWVTGAATEDVVLRLGDAVGVNKVSIRDYANVEVAYIDSDGNLVATSVGTPRTATEQQIKLYESNAHGDNQTTIKTMHDSSGNSTITFGNQSLDFATGTYTNTYLCNYTASGTVFGCNVAPSTFATAAQTFYIGTTQVAINRTSAALTLAGITLTTPDIGAATGTSLAFGADPADSGAIRLSNNTAVAWEQSSPGTDIFVALDGSNIFQVGQNAANITLGGPTKVTTAITPTAADAGTLGTTALEWSDLYLADGGVIYFGNDQDVTLTHVADTGLSLNLNLSVGGTIQGKIKIDSDANGEDNSTMAAAGLYGTMFIATGAGTWMLPTAVEGMNLCLVSSGAHADLILDIQPADTMMLKGTEGSAGVGITNAASTTAGDFVCVVATAAGHWMTLGMGGAWLSQ